MTKQEKMMLFRQAEQARENYIKAKCADESYRANAVAAARASLDAVNGVIGLFDLNEELAAYRAEHKRAEP